MYHNKVFSAFKPTGVIILGACMGEEFNDIRLNGATKIVAAECNPHLIDKYIRPKLTENDYLITDAISDVDGDNVTFYLHAADKFDNFGKTFDNPGCSSLLPLKDHLKWYPHINVTEEITVNTTTVDTFFRKNNIDPSEYNMLMMDLQGAELKAISGMKEILPHIDVIYTEITHNEMYAGGATSREMVRLFSELGFDLQEYFPMHQTWGDAWFKRAHA